MNRAELLPHAENVLEALRPVCYEVEIAGSVRRGMEEVKDLEIVAIPHWSLDLLGDPLDSPPLEEMIRAGIRAGVLEWDTVTKRNGPRYKRFRIPKAGGVALDLFLTDSRNFGNQMAIRTGDAEFSAWMMAQRVVGSRIFGGMPSGFIQCAGYLWDCGGGDAELRRRVENEQAVRAVGKEKRPALLQQLGAVIVPCPTETAYFKALGLPYVQPCDRNSACTKRLRAWLKKRAMEGRIGYDPSGVHGARG